MVRQKKEFSRLDAMLDDLIGESLQPEDILGKSGLLNPMAYQEVAPPTRPRAQTSHPNAANKY